MKEKTINYILVGLLVITFFFSIIPILTESQMGVCIPANPNVEEDYFCSPNEWIYGGTYFTSVLKQQQLGNYPFVFSFLSLFLVGFGANKFWGRS